jgi:ankyrin repeat protein
LFYLNDVDSLQRMISHDSSILDSLDVQLIVNPQRQSQASLVHLASFLGNVDVVNTLIAAGINVNIPDTRRQTPLLLACMTGSEDVVSLLLSHCADPTIPDEIGATPFHWLFAFDDPSAVRIGRKLMKSITKSIINQSTFSYYPIEALCLALDGPPLQWAIAARSEKTVKTLLSLGASPLQKFPDRQGFGRKSTPLEFSCGLLYYDIVPLFIEHRTPNHGSLSPYFHLGRDLEPFQGWIVHGKEYFCDAAVKTIQVLQQAGYDIEEVDDDILGNTPLLSAVLDSQPEVVRGLLKCGADINARNLMDATALHLVFEGDDAPKNQLQMEVLQILLEGGADVDALTDEGVSPLHNIIFNARGNDAVKEFLRYNPDLTIRNNQGQTYLHIIATAGEDLSEEVIDQFILHESYIDAEDNEGHTPLELAAMDFSEVKVKYFLDRNAKVTFKGGRTILHWMIRIGTDRYGYYPGFFDFLLSHVKVKPCIYMMDDYGRTALHEAALYASPKYVLALLRAGSDPTARDFGGMTPLQLSRACLANPPDFLVADNVMKEYYERYRTRYLVDLNDVIDILEGK